MRRREMLKLAAVGAAGMALPSVSSGAEEKIPIIDTHIHLFDTERKGGVPWPIPQDKVLFKPALPARYAALSTKEGVVGAIVIEASPLLEDNDWVLGQVEAHPLLVGMIGNLVPNDPNFTKELERLRANKYFLGIRYGNLWERDLFSDLDKPGFVDGLKALANAGLVFESANPDPALMQALVRVSSKVPDLRIVVDHLPNAKVPPEQDKRGQFLRDLQTLAGNPHVYVKLSEVPMRADNQPGSKVSFNKSTLDALWGIFGENRLLFGSDWPNSDGTAPFDQTLSIVRGYLNTKSVAAQEKYYWRNSIAAYKWKPRRPNQNLS